MELRAAAVKIAEPVEASRCTNQSRSIADTGRRACRASSSARRRSGPNGTRPTERPVGRRRRRRGDVLLQHRLRPTLAQERQVATSAGVLRLKRGGAMSSSVPPPIVTIGE